MSNVPIKDAATVILLRDRTTAPKVLMGQRGARAAFMPSKVVFPGGAVDPQDAAVPLDVPEPCASRLAVESSAPPTALAAAAIRELWEETGQALARGGLWPDAPPGWLGFASEGLVPDASGLTYIFRAVTPPGRPRRFDARFFLADADDLSSDPDDFSAAEDELSHIGWIPLSEVRSYDLPFITEVVLAEVVAGLDRTGPPETVPFFRNDDERHLVTALRGRSPLE